jgi:hypothetical protein
MRRMKWEMDRVAIAESGVNSILKSDLGSTVKQWGVQRTGNVIVALFKLDQDFGHWNKSPSEVSEKYIKASGGAFDMDMNADELFSNGVNMVLRVGK